MVKYNDLELTYTISVGISEVNSAIESHETWIEYADAALYSAKENGRNKVSLHPQRA